MPKSLAVLRQEAAQRQSNLCHYCGFPMWEGQPSGFIERYGVSQPQARLLQCTAEHLIPKSEAGKDSPQNIVAACRYCNQTRHRASVPLSPDAYKLRVGRLMEKGKWFPRELRQKVLHAQ